MKRVVVTGANKGIGLALVEKILTERDDTFVYLGSRDAGRGEAARDRIVAKHSAVAGRVQVLQIDVSSDESVKAAAASLSGQQLYALSNNAGIWGEPADIFNTNLTGVIRCTAAFRPLLDVNDSRIVHTSSGSAPAYVEKCSPERKAVFLNKTSTVQEVEKEAADFLKLLVANDAAGLQAEGYPAPDAQSAYGASKAFLNAYTLALANEMSSVPGILVNSCSPGFIYTDLISSFFGVAPGQATADAEAGHVPEQAASKGALPPSKGANSPFFLLFGPREVIGGSGRYFGSDCKRSPMDRYRAPGSEEYKEYA